MVTSSKFEIFDSHFSNFISLSDSKFIISNSNSFGKFENTELSIDVEFMDSWETEIVFNNSLVTGLNFNSSDMFKIVDNSVLHILDSQFKIVNYKGELFNVK